MKRIAIFLPNWIGDVVMATPAVQAIREAFGEAELTAVCKPYVADVLAGNPWFRSTILLDKQGLRSQRWLAVATQLRQQPTDAAVLFPNSFRVAAIARLAGARRIVGFNRYGRGPLLTHRLHAQRDEHGRWAPAPVIVDYNRLALELGSADPGYRMQLFTTGEDERRAEAIWERLALQRYPRVILLNPGAAFGAAKHWPIESFAQLARQFAQRMHAGVLVLCGPSERTMARQIAEGSRSPNVFSLHDADLSIGLTKACVRRGDLLVTTDSGPRHFAAAFRRPVVTLFGPTHIAWTETYYARAIHLQKQVPCGPCQQRVCPLDHRCMRDLGPAEVFASAERLLARFPLTRATEGNRAA